MVENPKDRFSNDAAKVMINATEIKIILCTPREGYAKSDLYLLCVE